MAYQPTTPIDASEAAANPAAVRERLEQSRDLEQLAAGDEPIGYVMSADTAERVRAVLDAPNIRRAHKESLRGEGKEVGRFFTELREKLQAMKRAG